MGSRKAKQPPKKHKAIYDDVKGLVMLLRDCYSQVSKKLLYDYMEEKYEAFRVLTYTGKESFWIRMKVYCRFVRRRINGTTQLLPSDYLERQEAFDAMGKSMYLQRGGFDVVIFSDETPTVQEPVANYTLDKKGAKHVRVKTAGKEKEVVTVWLASKWKRGEGVTNFKPHIIWSTPTNEGPIAKDTRAAAEEHGATTDTSESGWTTGPTFFNWVQRNLTPETAPPLKTLFIVDLYKAHRTEDVTGWCSEHGIDVLFGSNLWDHKRCSECRSWKPMKSIDLPSTYFDDAPNPG